MAYAPTVGGADMALERLRQVLAKSSPAIAMTAALSVALLFGAAAQASAPSAFNAVPGDAEATLFWSHPDYWADPDDGAITGYSVRHATSEAALSSEAWTAISISDDDAATVGHTVSGLTNGTRYYFQVRATSAAGDGPPSTATIRLAASPTAVVAINDDGLRNALEQSLGADFTQLDLATLVGSVYAAVRGISDLTGLEHAVNLARLSLEGNAISDVSVLGSLDSLTVLRLNYNAISDVSALGSLDSLTELYLYNNSISDVSALGSLESLTKLWLYNNEITDVSALGSLESLTELYLNNNEITDVSALGSLESLTELYLNNNEITDVSALGSLESLTELYLNNNEITDVSALGSLESLTWLELNNNAISDVSALGSLESLTRLYLNNNAISDVSALGSLESQSLSELHLRGNLLSGAPVFGSALRVGTLDLADNAISDVSGLGSLESVGDLVLADNLISDVSTLGSIESLRGLNLEGNAISDVSGLGSLESLTGLDLGYNAVTDISALGSLESLAFLDLKHNAISDVSALGSLESLTRLDLSDNAISDVSALGSLESLTRLYLHNNEISDVSAFRSLRSLTRLYLYNNAISDVSALGWLRSLEWLDLRDNEISDVSMLRSLRFLTALDLNNNEISDVSPLGSLGSLKWLGLSGNAISDISALGSLTSLLVLYLSDNAISDISALGSLGLLGALDLRNNAISDVSSTPWRYGSRYDFGGNRIAELDFYLDYVPSAIGFRDNPLSADAIERVIPWMRRDAGEVVVAGWPVLIFPSAADPSGRQGFVRVVNRSAVGGEVRIDAWDDAGERFGPLRLAIGPGEAAHFNSQDLEAGNAAKGLSGGVGAPTAGHWRLELSSTLDIEVLSYVRTPDGFLTSVHDVLPRQASRLDQGSHLGAAMLNPGSNSAQRSSLRLVNPSRGGWSVSVDGWDDRGHVSRIWSEDLPRIPPGGAVTLDAAALETGGLGDGSLPSFGGLGDGAGKWRLAIELPWPVEGVSLLTSPGGHLTNLSTAPDAGADGVWRMPLFPAADGASGRQGFVRVINRSGPGEVQVVAVDDGGARVGPVTLTLNARQTVHFNSGDLQRGNAAKGLPDGVGSPTRGDWRLELTSDLDIAVTSYIRTEDGFLTSMHDLAPPGVAAQAARVPIFNPGSNRRQVSLLRVVNDGDAAATVRVTGVDDAGMPSGEVRLTVPAGETRTLEAADLEAGNAAFEGALGDGVGKWRLAVASDVPVGVMSLLRSPSGHLTNLSTGTRP